MCDTTFCEDFTEKYACNSGGWAGHYWAKDNTHVPELGEDVLAQICILCNLYIYIDYDMPDGECSLAYYNI